MKLDSGRTSAAGLAIAAVLSVGACAEPAAGSGTAPATVSTTSTVTQPTGAGTAGQGWRPAGPRATRLLVSPADPGARFEARLSGRLGVNDRGCVTLGRLVVVAPRDSRLSPDGATVTLAGLGDFRLGDTVSTGGGYQEEADIPSDRLPVDHRGCAGTSFAIITPGPSAAG